MSNDARSFFEADERGPSHFYLSCMIAAVLLAEMGNNQVTFHESIFFNLSLLLLTAF